MLLKGNTYVITGCLQGIGRSTLDTFCANGANVFACAMQETEEFMSHVDQLKETYGVNVIPVFFDMMDNDQIKHAARVIQKEKLPIDGLVNIAGLNRDALFPMVTMEQLQTTFQVNFFAQILFSQYMMKLMQRNPGKCGTVVNIASIAGIEGNIGQLAYASSKAALIAATKTMALELGEKGIRVNAIAPGVIETPMTEALAEDVIERKLKHVELNRIGKPEEVADLIMYLSSDLSSHVTGQVIRVDGGIG